MSFEYSGYDSEEEYQRAVNRHKVGKLADGTEPGGWDVAVIIGMIVAIIIIWQLIAG